ncbi:MAG: UbiA family prenyltransferase [Bacteriovoracaceae bacterium]|nr:UbiA family prenyltransferase [Bacteriovoracaceae bacterium]
MMSEWKLYLIHMRPKTFLPSFVFVLSGYALNPSKENWWYEIPLLFILYSVLLFGGTCALNTHVDRDVGPLNFLDNPPPRPKWLGHFGILCMVLACHISYFFGPYVFWSSITALITSYAYSGRVPGIKWRGKEVGGVDLVIDASGCGVIAIIMGASIAGVEPTSRTWMIGWLFTLTAAGSYAATQIFQLKPTDTYETARNFSSLLGAQLALRVGAVMLISGLLGVGWLLYPDLMNHGVSSYSQILYALFFVIFSWGVVQCLRWSKSPFENATPQFKSVIFTLLGARLFWIAAEWLR